MFLGRWRSTSTLWLAPTGPAAPSSPPPPPQVPWQKIERERQNWARSTEEGERRAQQAAERDERRQRRIAAVRGQRGPSALGCWAGLGWAGRRWPCPAMCQPACLPSPVLLQLLPLTHMQAGIDYTYEPLQASLPKKSKRTVFND